METKNTTKTEEKLKSPYKGQNSSNAAGHKKGQEQPARFALVEVEVKDIVTEKTLCVLNRVPTTTTTRFCIKFRDQLGRFIFFRELKKLFEREFPAFYVERQSFHLDKKAKGSHFSFLLR